MSAVWRHSTGGMVIVGDLLISMQRYPSRTAHTKSKDVQLGEDISSLSLSQQEKKKIALVFFPQHRLNSPSSGLDQQSADWCTITTSVQTAAATDANLPLWAQCGGSRDLLEHVSVGICCCLHLFVSVCLYLHPSSATVPGLFLSSERFLREGNCLRIPGGICFTLTPSPNPRSIIVYLVF